VPITSELTVIQRHSKWHYSIDNTRLPIYQSAIVSIALSCTIFELLDVKILWPWNPC